MKKASLIVSILFILCSFTYNGHKDELNQLFKKGNRVMKLEFDTNKKYLELNKTTTLKISFENISVSSFSIYGSGIQMAGGGKNFIKCKISPYEKFLIKNQLEVSLFEDINGKKELFRKFLIPVKIN